MSSNSPPSRGLSPDDALPPVQPPNAGFILQLFIVPGVIVVVVVLVWVMFNWLAQKGNDRDAFVRDLGRNNEARWQAAFNLANALRAERKSSQPTLATDDKLAAQLADILQREIEAGKLDDNSLSLRVYLCRALGEFRVADGLPALIKAASTVRDPKEEDVRRAALEGIAVLASNVSDKTAFNDNAQLRNVLLAAADAGDPGLRGLGAVAMGVIGGSANVEKLQHMLDDLDANVRYNAATRLAALGDAASIRVLAEMLDQTETAGVNSEKDPTLRKYKRDVINVNALRATHQLAEKNSDADLGSLKPLVEKLLEGELPGSIRIEATSTLKALDSRVHQPAA